jgi:taurine dioxygenase
LVRIHPETGRKHLFFDGLSSTRVVGLHRHEGQALLQFLRAHLADPTFACRHQWRDGDFVMWDNRATVHRSTGDYAGRRVSHRVTLTRLPGTREQ